MTVSGCLNLMTLVGADMVGEAKTVSEPVLVISVNQPDSKHLVSIAHLSISDCYQFITC